MQTSSIQEIFEAFTTKKVLIIGDVMVDSYVYGKVHRISPEAPVPVVQVHSKERRLGGAGNVALNVLRLGADVTLCSLVGDDPEAGEVFERLEARNITREGIVVSHERMTTVKERIISGSQHIARVDTENSAPTTKEEEKDILEVISKLLPEHDVVVFEDYDKGTINARVIEKTVQMAKDQDIPVVVDPKKRNFLAYKNVSLFKPNLKELREGLKIDSPLQKNEEIIAAVNRLKEKLNFDKVMITLSDRGIYIEDGISHHFIPAHLRKISDVSGAGDTVVSIAALCLTLDLPARVIGELSNLGGGLVCEYVGVVPIEKDRLILEAERLNLMVQL